VNATPPPSDVHGNDWRSLAVEPLESFRPTLGVSVIVTYYEAPDALELTLAALEGQDYPHELFEVVIVDDGSATPLATPADSPLSLRVMHQQDQGFGLARARNTGARAATQPILVFLDCDMLPETQWLSAHARWHHRASDLITLGFRAHVDVEGITTDEIRSRNGSLQDLFAGRPWQRPEWIDSHMSRTNDLTEADDIFRAVTGGYLGVSKAFYEPGGGYDESFTQWGTEDTEFGYRAYAHGALLIPERAAMCWHQGEGASPSAQETASLELQRAKISQLIAHPGFRRAGPGRSFTVPQYVVTLRTTSYGLPASVEAVEQILADSVHDLVVWIEEPPGSDITRSDEHEKLRRLLAGDPRVHFGKINGALDAFGSAAFHVTMPGDATVGSDIVKKLRQQLGTDPIASTNTADPAKGVTIARGWVLHRAARRSIALNRCEVVTPLDLSTSDVVTLSTSTPVWQRLQSRTRRLGRLLRRLVRRTRHFGNRNLKRTAAVNRSIRREASTVRSLGDARDFGRWASESVGVIGRKRLNETGIMLRAHLLAHYRLGPNMATCGPLSNAVFEASTDVAKTLNDHTQVLLADSTDHVQAATGTAISTQTLEESGLETLLLHQLVPSASVPAFNIEKFNPVGWRGNARKPATTGSVLSRRLARPVSVHHVKDSATNHRDTRSRAATLVTMAAQGVVVSLDAADDDLAPLLGDELYALMLDERVTTADVHTREVLSIAMRRCALRDHSLRARARQVLAASSYTGPQLPLVSVLLATRRPHRVKAAVQAVARQNYPRVELVLAAHGEGFDSANVDEALAGLDSAKVTVAVAASEPLGAVLNAAVSKSSGELLTKFDDDDFYGPHHLWDLVLAHEYSRAALIGKGAEYVYLADSDRTVHRFRNRSERRSSRTLAGGALLISRNHLDSVFGWRPIPSGVDRALIDDVFNAGLRTYRTHGSGYMLVRHAEGHTWSTTDAYFLKQADEVRAGCDLKFAGIE